MTRPNSPQQTAYNPALHRDSLIGYLSAYDDDDLPDGAWQAMIEDGAKEFSKQFGVRIDPFDAFIEYVEHGDK